MPIFLSALMVFCALGKAAEPERPQGLWMGTLTIAFIQKLRLVVEVNLGPNGKLVARMDSIDQGAYGIPVTSIEANAETMKFSITSLNAKYSGIWNQKTKKYEGTFEQNGAKLSLAFERISERPKVSRPQDPKPPFPYVEHEVIVENRAENPIVKLAGTLTIPKTKGPHPVAVLITGSGAQNRNEELMNHRPFLVLADHLARNGIAVLRMDDRGVGGSSKGTDKDTSETFAGDILAAVHFLKTRAEIDHGNIGLIGHSEGGIIAPKVAVQAPGQLAFLVLLAGPALPGSDILKLQSGLILKANGASSDEVESNVRVQEALFKILGDETDQKKAAEKLDQEMIRLAPKMPAKIKALLEKPEHRLNNVRMLNNAWMRYFLQYDPRPTLQKVTCPTLALLGEKDLQVPAKQNREEFERIAKERKSIEVKTMLGQNHLFQKCPTGNPAEYAVIAETMSPETLKEISEWVNRVVKSSAAATGSK